MSRSTAVSEQGARTIPLSVHGSAGVLDVVVPTGATSLDVAREYAREAGLEAIPLLQTSVGRLLPGGTALAELGVEAGDVLVAATGVHRTRRESLVDAMRGAPDSPALAGLVAALAAGLAVLSGWCAAQAGNDTVRTATVGVLLACAFLAAAPVGRHARQRVVAAPAFGGAAAFAALYEPGLDLLPSVLAAAALAAAVVAATARMLADEPDEAGTVWIVAGLVVFAVCLVTPLFGWDPRVVWTLLLFVAMMATRFAPSLVVNVPDETLLDLERLAVTAWSARAQPGGSKRGRIVVAGDAMSRLVRRASRLVTAAAAAIAVVTAVSAPLLLATATIDLDRIGARCLVFFAGASILLAARSYRHAAARALLRVAGLAAWLALAVSLVRDTGDSHAVAFAATVLALGAIAVTAAVATGRGWRSIWWARRAEVAESLCGSFAFAAAVVAAGVFRGLWEITS